MIYFNKLMKQTMVLLFILTLGLSFIQPAFADNGDNYLMINRQKKHLGSRLHIRYEGYIYTIKNTSGSPINIQGVSFQDNLTGKAAYLSIKRSSIKEGLGTIGTGLVYAIPTLTISVFVSVIIAPIKMVANTIGNIGASQDSHRYDKTIDNVILAPNEKIILKTIAVKHNPPKLKLFYCVQGDDNKLIELEK